MIKHERLGDADRRLRRTAMDALEVLRKESGFQDSDRAEFHIGLMRLLPGNRVGLVDLRFESPIRKSVCCVSLPAATHFKALPEGFPVFRRFEIMRLSQAWIDGRGRVRLHDGGELRAVEIEPTHLPFQPSDLDWRIVHFTLELVGATDCYRSLRDDVPPDQRGRMPDLRFLDLARLSRLTLPPLQDITRLFAKKQQDVSGQQIANALAKFGIRRPQPRLG